MSSDPPRMRPERRETRPPVRGRASSAVELGSAAAPGVLPAADVPQQDQHHDQRDAADPEVLHPALVFAEEVAQQDQDGDPGADAPRPAGLAVPAPVLGPLVLDGVVTDADDALFTTGLVDPLRLAHALLLAGARRPPSRRCLVLGPARALASTDILAGTRA